MKKENIGIITFPIGKSGCPPTSNLLDIFASISNEIYLITGNMGLDLAKGKTNIHIFNLNHKKSANIFIRILRYIIVQLKISYYLNKNRKKTRLWVFFIGGSTLILPMILARLLRKKVILVLPGSSTESFKSSNSLLTTPIKISENINFLLSNHIILYSSNLINEWHLERYLNKIKIADRHFLDLDLFKINKTIDERKNVIGYIGRLSEEKGILIFVRLIQVATKKGKDLQFLIGGDGEAHDKIRNYVNDHYLNDKVKIIGWIPHDELPNYLNELKLLVLPSYTEGLPNILLEAMACGTPVLVTPVGSVPDIIQDGKTGFIIKNNNEEEIMEDVLRILNHASLDIVIKNARNFIEKKFSFATKVEDYKKILRDVLE